MDVVIAKLKDNLNIEQRNLAAYKAENESLKYEIEGLKKIIAERNHTIDRMNSAADALKWCIQVMAGKKKR